MRRISTKTMPTFPFRRTTNPMPPYQLTNKHLDQLVKLVRDTGGK